jgi:Ca-activated chloride channel family protein
VAAVGIDGAPERVEEVTISGQRVERSFDYSTGELRISATRNGALSDVTYRVFAVGNREAAVATGRTYRQASSNPARVRLVAGEYEVVLKAIEIADAPEQPLGKVTIAPAGSAALAHDFRSGELLVGAVRGGQLVDATVSVQQGGRRVAAGRTYTSASSNPKRFVLLPGDYEVEVSEVRGEKRRFTIAVTAAAVGERTIDFNAP